MWYGESHSTFLGRNFPNYYLKRFGFTAFKVPFRDKMLCNSLKTIHKRRKAEGCIDNLGSWTPRWTAATLKLISEPPWDYVSPPICKEWPYWVSEYEKDLFRGVKQMRIYCDEDEPGAGRWWRSVGSEHLSKNNEGGKKKRAWCDLRAGAALSVESW